MNDFNERIATLSPEKRELLALQLKRRGLQFNTFPLSYGQQRLWFIEQLDPGNGSYNISLAMRLKGELKIEALEKALTEIVQRHEVLRTTFPALDGEPMQVIGPAKPQRLEIIDLTEITNQEEQARRIVREEAQRRFDLAAGPLFRTMLLRLSAHEHVAMISMHHIVSDGWSMNILLREVSILYTAYLNGAESPLSELPLQYADYARWQRERLSGERLEEQLRYWKNQLGGGAQRVLELPLDHRRSAMQTFQGGVHAFRLPAELAGALMSWSEQEGVTLFMTLLAAFKVLLYRYTGEKEIVVGTAVANRNRLEVEKLIGFFVNTLVLRTAVDGTDSFRELVQRVRQVTLDAYSHEEVPFEKLVEELEPERSLSHTPLFQVMFGLQSAPPDAVKMGKIEMTTFGTGGTAAQFDLSLGMIEAGDEVTAVFGYNTDLFEAETIKRMARHLEQLLESAMQSPQQRVSELTMLASGEYQQLAEWNDNVADFPKLCLHQLFEAQVERTPHAIALVFEDEQLTYSELNRRANQLAHYLHQRGIGAESLVAVILERKVEMVVALLAVLKAGAAYVPIDPEYPRERIIYMLTDCGAVLALTEARLAESLSIEDMTASGCEVAIIDNEIERIAEQSEKNLASKVNADILAYVIYTSGSTGKPKGVMVEHSSVANIIISSIEQFRFDENDVMPLLANFAFDIFLFELFTLLASGGRAVLLAGEHRYNPPLMVDTFRGMTSIHMVPGLMQLLISHLKQNEYPVLNLKRVFVGGELVSIELLEEMRKVFPFAQIHILYGPTEATIICASYQLPRDATQEHTLIGVPFKNTQIRLYDKQRQLVPVGVVGELYIGGAGISRGYLHREDLTREKYVVIDGERFYRTGDMGRRNTAGEIEFIGRNDEQVKIRGYRIELGEVEAVLRQHPGVRETIVVAHADGTADKRLVAYVVPDPRHLSNKGQNGNGQAAQSRSDVQLWPSIGEYFVYDELIYYGLTNDEPRNEKYRNAMRKLVPDKVVVEIGTGRDAILARLCVESGAKRVYAIEIQEQSYLAAQERVRGLGLAEKIVVIHGDARKVELPEKADVCVSEIFEAIGGAEGAAVVLNSARRFLKKEGMFIPRRSVTRIAAARLPDELWENPSFTEVSSSYVEKIFEQVGHKFDLRLCIKDFPAANIISNVEVFEDLDFDDYVAAEYSRELTLHIHERARIDGFLVWLSLEMVEGEVLDIMEREYSWFPVYLPVFYPGIEVSQGDTIKATVTSVLTENGVNPEYVIKGSLLKKDGERVDFQYEAIHHQQRYQQTPFYRRLFKDDVVPVARAKGGGKLKGLREHLKQYLPQYMIPSTILLLESLPLTANGKVDRRALPSPDTGRPELEQTYLPPRTAMEERIAGIWKKVLPVREVGVYDNFFQLGGHSLLATQVMSRVRDAFKLQVPLRKMFELPTVAGLAEYVEQEIAVASGPEAEPLQRISRQQRLPLSYAQQRLWFIEQLDPGNVSYNVPVAVRLRGELQVEAVGRALSEVVRRHEALRTTFRKVDGEPVQVIAAAEAAPLTVTDLSEMEAPEEQARLLAQAEAARPFALDQGPLFRATLLKLSAQEHVALLSMHHIVSDGWSLNILLQEVSTLYTAYVNGAESPLAELPLQYADYASWQREWLSGARLEEELGYWKAQLSGAPAVLALPTDHARPAVQTFNGAMQGMTLSAELSQRLRRWSEREGVTLFMTLLAAFKVLLHRYSGETEIVVGTPVANRNRLEVEGLIGFFVNTLVLRTEVKSESSFAELTQRVKEVALGAYSHQEVPFEKLVEALEPERSLSHTPLFQVMFGLQNMPLEEASMTALEMRPFRSRATTAKFDLSLAMMEAGERITGAFEYNSDLFEAETVSRMAGHLEQLLESAMAQPQARVSELGMLTAVEEQQLLVEWNETAGETTELCLHELFEAQVERTPAAIALMFEAERLSYGELNQRANQLGHYLRQRGVGAETLVAVMLERGVEMVVALLAVMKAGAAYVFMDPDYPTERIARMLVDSHSQFLLSSARLARNLSENSAPLIDLEAEQAEIAKYGSGPVAAPVCNQDLACVIYTSGTTGKPKGVMLEHRHLVNTLEGVQQTYQFSSDDVLPCIASFSFDIALFELFSPLLVGGTSILLTKAHVLDLPVFARTLEQATFLHTLPSLMSQLVGYVGEKNLHERYQRMRGVFVGGDLIPRELPQKIQAAFPNAQVWIGYGPTETAMICANMKVSTEQPLEHYLIGRPLKNVQIRIYDNARQLVPVGIAGELYVGGAGVSRGYLRREALTREKFVEIEGKRFYRTGDVGRWNAGGYLEFLGRTDEQVKVRGYRIELGEVETVLRQHPAVREAAVIAVADERGEKRLAAYVVPEQETLAVTELRQFLQQQLPEYMMPSTFVTLAELPLSTTRKVNRRALPKPEAIEKGSGEFVAPRDSLELQLAQIWEDLLGRSPIGIRNSFFDVGGHSLLAVRLMWMIEDRFGQKLELSVLFQGPTIEQLAKQLSGEQTAPSSSILVSLQPEGTKAPLFCVHPGGGEVMCYYRLAQQLGRERPFYGLQAPSLSEIGEGEDNYTTIEARAAAYIEALRAVQPAGPYFLAGWSFGGVVAFEMAQQLQRAGEKVGLLALLDTVAPVLATDLDEAESGKILAALAREHASKTGRPFALSSAELLELEPEEQLRYVLEKMKAAEVVAADIREEIALPWMSRMLKGYRSRGRAYQAYTPEVYAGEITLFKANINPGHLKDTGMKEITALFLDPTYCWADLSTEPIKIEKVSGYHEILLSEPHVQILAERLQASFDLTEAKAE